MNVNKINVNDQHQATFPSIESSNSDFDIRDTSGYILTQFKDGHLKTKNFDSNAAVQTTDSNADLEFIDSSSNCVMRVNNGHIRTKNFNSVNIYTKEEVDTLIHSSSSDDLTGLKYAALGDSITWGYTPHSLPGEGSKLKSYAKLTAEALGLTYYDYAISGNQLAKANDSMSVRYTSMTNDADIVTFMGGTNDIRNGVQLGTFTDRTNQTYYGALHVLIQGLIQKYRTPDHNTNGYRKTIIALTPIKMLYTPASTAYGEGTLYNQQTWIDAVKEVAAYYAIPCLDLYSCSGICPQFADDYYATNYSKTGYFNYCCPDGIHVSQMGANMMANQLIKFIKNLITIK